MALSFFLHKFQCSIGAEMGAHTTFIALGGEGDGSIAVYKTIYHQHGCQGIEFSGLQEGTPQLACQTSHAPVIMDFNCFLGHKAISPFSLFRIDYMSLTSKIQSLFG